MTEHNPVSIQIDGDNLYANSQLLGLLKITGGDNIQLDNSGGIVNVVQDPSFTSLVVNNTSTLTGDVSFGGDISANTATFDGTLTLNDIIKIQPNTDNVVAEIGRAKIGYNGSNVNTASFSHWNNMNGMDYALKQNLQGKTTINAKSGQNILFTNSNSTKAQVEADGTFNIDDGTGNGRDKLKVYSGFNHNASILVDNLRIGNVSLNKNYGGMSHVNQPYTTDADYMIRQNGAGTTHINASASRAIQFYQAGVEKARMNPNGTWTFYTYVTFSGGSSSDDRIKNNEEPITNALDTIMKLKPQTYDKTQTNGEGDYTEIVRESGIIAQDIYYDTPELRHIVKLPSDTSANNILSRPEEITPTGDAEALTDIQQDPDYTALGWGQEMAAVSYTQLIPWLVKGMQEQQTEIEQLKTTNSQLNTTIASMEARLLALENP